MKHSQCVPCKLCDFECGTDSELLLPEEQVHKKSKFSCDKCNTTYPSSRKLQDHKQHKHSDISWYPCDYCGFKCANVDDLDSHIETVHKSDNQSNKRQRRKDFEIRDVRNKKPCDPSDPRHSNRCCDRKSSYETNYYTSEEKEKNGPCRAWNDGYCSFSNCKFLHAEICTFQSRCRYGSSHCRFFHFKSLQQENSFLGRRNQSQNFFQQDESVPQEGNFC